MNVRLKKRKKCIDESWFCKQKQEWRGKHLFTIVKRKIQELARLFVDNWNGVSCCFLSGYNSWLLLTGFWSCSSLRRCPPVWRCPPVRRCSLRPAAVPTAGGRHCPARHVHRSRPVEQPRQRLPVLLRLHHDMLLPASWHCRPDLFNPSEFNLREWRPHPWAGRLVGLQWGPQPCERPIDSAIQLSFNYWGD